MGWKLSFDRVSQRWKGEAVLNLVRTSDEGDVFYTTVLQVDDEVYRKLLEREMGESTSKRHQRGESISLDSYRPVALDSRYGQTEIFIIPKARGPNPTNWNAAYVQVVKHGIEESYEGEKREANLRALRRAVAESQRQVRTL